jgi:hypothetical protein
MITLLACCILGVCICVDGYKLSLLFRLSLPFLFASSLISCSNEIMNLISNCTLLKIKIKNYMHHHGSIRIKRLYNDKKHSVKKYQREYFEVSFYLTT